MSDMPKAIYAPIKLAGHINIANERGMHPGCYAVMFRPNEVEGGVAEQMNQYFEFKAHAALVTEMLLGPHGELLVLFTKRLAGDDKAEMDEFNAHYAEWRADKKLKQKEAEERVKVAIEAETKRLAGERDKMLKQVKALVAVAMTHLKNCKKKSPEEVMEAKRAMEEFLVAEQQDKANLANGQLELDLTPKEHP